MTHKEAVNWLINLTADIGKAEHHDLWHYEQALTEIKEMLEALNDAENANYGERKYNEDKNKSFSRLYENDNHFADVSKMYIKDKTFGHISRWSAIKEICDIYFNAKEWKNKAVDREIQARAESCMDTCFEIKLRIEALPSVQPERKRGRWIYGEDEYGIDGYHCDKCGFFVPWDYTHTFINYITDYNFCPSCGAEMSEGGKDALN